MSLDSDGGRGDRLRPRRRGGQLRGSRRATVDRGRLGSVGRGPCARGLRWSGRERPANGPPRGRPRTGLRTGSRWSATRRRDDPLRRTGSAWCRHASEARLASLRRMTGPTGPERGDGPRCLPLVACSSGPRRRTSTGFEPSGFRGPGVRDVRHVARRGDGHPLAAGTRVRRGRGRRVRGRRLGPCPGRPPCRGRGGQPGGRRRFGGAAHPRRRRPLAPDRLRRGGRGPAGPPGRGPRDRP